MAELRTASHGKLHIGKRLTLSTLNNSESIWPPPFSIGVYQNEEPAPEGQRDKEISLSQFISSLFDGVWQLLPGDFEGVLLAAPRSWGLLLPKGASEVFSKYTGCNGSLTN